MSEDKTFVDIKISGKNGLSCKGLNKNQTWYKVWDIRQFLFNKDGEVVGQVKSILFTEICEDNPRLPSGFNFRKRIGEVRNERNK